ncbi:MAG: hemerythrin domain-containing protein [Comamonas sp.]|nr:hemerythrin domain-containing protein [Comamonas sp.]
MRPETITELTTEQLQATSDQDLVKHILSRYHAIHREQLPELIRLAQKVESVHASSGNCPHGLADCLQGLAQELDAHMRKEEMVLFPLISRGQGAMAAMPINVMRMEHEDHGAELQRLAALTHDITTPEGACTTWRKLYQGLREFRDDLLAHIDTENNILFERFAPTH